MKKGAELLESTRFFQGYRQVALHQQAHKQSTPHGDVTFQYACSRCENWRYSGRENKNLKVQYSVF